MNNELIQDVMDHIGLEVNNGNIFDQDTGCRLQFNNKGLKYRPFTTPVVHKDEIEFNPLANRKLAMHLFSYYTEKFSKDHPDRHIGLFYPVDDSEIKGRIEVKISKKDGSTETISSGSYKNDALKYIDLIMRLDGKHDVDLSRYDSRKVRTLNRTAKRRKAI